MPTPQASTAVSVSRMRALKRQRLVTVEDPDYPDEHYVTVRPLPHGPHAPNKAEARVLRRICAQTGLSPEQVREHKVYRVQLAEAAKASHARAGGREGQLYKQFVRRVRASTQAAPWTLEFKELFVAEWERRRAQSYRWPMNWSLRGEDAYAHFAKERGYKVPAQQAKEGG